MSDSTVLYKKLMEEAQKKKLKLNSDSIRKLNKLYESTLESVIRKAGSARGGFTKTWLKDYEKFLRIKMNELNEQLVRLTKDTIKTSSQIASSVEGDFLTHIDNKYDLDIPIELIDFAYSINNDAILNIINGGFYKDNKSLSDRIWGYGDKNISDIQYILNKGMMEQKSYLEIVKDLEKYVNPTAKKDFNWKRVYPGVNKNVDYNAQRLLRTSMNHSFFNSNISNWNENPYVEAIHWELSSQHYSRQIKVFGPDVCDDYTNQDDYGLGQGNFPKDRVPIPHPQCLCYQYAVIPKSLDKIGRELRQWLNGDSNTLLDNWYNSSNKIGKNYKNNVSNIGNSGIIKERSISQRNMANGNRKSSKIKLSDDDKNHLLNEIEAIKADKSIFIFRDGFGSGYSDKRDKIFISSNIYPSNDGSMHPRDLMSERAALAHEYYGHRTNRGTKLNQGSWNDEFRASYIAAKICPNLSDEDRMYLILDSIERAKEAGVSIEYNSFMRRILYGY